MFENCEEIGSSNKDLILKGNVKIQWGKKLINLLDSNGNLNIKIQPLIKKVLSEDEIKTNGFYYYNNNLIAKIGNEILEIISESGNIYVSFMSEQKTTSEQKYTALKNIGFIYEKESDENIYPTNGIIYIEESQSLFIVNNGKLSKYNASLPTSDNDESSENKQFVIAENRDINSEGALIIEGIGENNSIKFNTLKIYSKEFDSILQFDNNIKFQIGNKEIIRIEPKGITTDYIQSYGANDDHGYTISEKNGIYTLNIDEINVREGIDYDYYYDNKIYSNRYIITYFKLVYDDNNNLLNVIFNTSINNITFVNNSLIEIPIRVIKCNLLQNILVPINRLTHTEYSKSSSKEVSIIDDEENMHIFKFKYIDSRLYLVDKNNNSLNCSLRPNHYLTSNGPIYESLLIDGIYYVFKNSDIEKNFIWRSLYVISEPNSINKRFKFDFDEKEPNITLFQNDLRNTKLSEHDQIEHVKIGNIGNESDIDLSNIQSIENIKKYKTYTDDTNTQGLFSDLNVFVGGEFRHPIPTYIKKNGMLVKIPSDIEYYHFPRYSEKLTRGINLNIFNHDEIILPKKWVPQAANYIEDLTAYSDTLQTRDDNLYEGKLFLYKISGQSSSQIQVRFKLSPQYDKNDQIINQEFTSFFGFYDRGNIVKENDYKLGTILLAQYKNGQINVLRQPGLITIQKDNYDIETEPNFDTLNFKNTDNIKFDLSKNNKTIVIKSDINTKLENRIKKLEDDVSQLRSDLDNLSDVVSGLSSSLSSLWNTVNNLDIPPDYGSDISDLESRVSTLEGNNNNNAS